MEKNDELYIGSVSPTIGVKEQRALTQTTIQLRAMLTEKEFVSIMAIYNNAIDRIFKENGIEEDKDETQGSK